MIDAPVRDRLDDVLRDYFRPGETPGDLARRVLRSGEAAEEALSRLEKRLGIEASADGICLVRAARVDAPATRAARRLVEQAREEIAEYFRGQRAFFTVPVDLSATPDFQRRVLEAARAIPFGEARPYAWVARRIGHPHAVRAVGTALGRNPVPLIVPCHRVWRSDGGLGGYLFGAGCKRELQALERRTPVLEGSSSTRIVCRVGCAYGRRVRQDHRVVFASVEDARSVGYRPCRVCRPAA
jgi:O-6-methylguanine DNA methyltransferase